MIIKTKSGNTLELSDTCINTLANIDAAKAGFTYNPRWPSTFLIEGNTTGILYRLTIYLKHLSALGLAYDDITQFTLNGKQFKVNNTVLLGGYLAVHYISS